MCIEGGLAVMPFVRMFCGRASTYLWEGDEGVVHNVEQGEGGEQEHQVMPPSMCSDRHPRLTGR